mmetsp:Transcript_86468/g.201184  ORF Transcript_86468/g.201184 Transcript_86468/m.201184 type:complete len:366 (-) Transcript_86468:1236-2333(-)
MRVERPQVAVRQTHAVLGHEDALEQARGPCVGLQVADVALGTRVQDGPVAVVCLLHTSQGTDLNGISQRGAGAVALGCSDVVGHDACLPKRGLDAELLRRPVGRCHTGTAAVLIHLVTNGASLLHLRIPVAIADIDIAHTGAFPSSVAVARHVKREATALQRQHVLTRATNVRAGIDNHVRASCKCCWAVRVDGGRLRAAFGRLLDRVHRGAEGREPGAAGGIADPRRAAQAQVEGEALASDSHGSASLPLQPACFVKVLPLHLPDQELIPPIAAAIPQIHQDGLAHQRLLGPAGPVERLVAHLQHLVLCWLHDAGLPLSVTKEAVVEAHDLSIVAQAAMVVVAVRIGNEICVSLLCEVEVCVEP